MFKVLEVGETVVLADDATDTSGEFDWPAGAEGTVKDVEDGVALVRINGFDNYVKIELEWED